jgi:hypothetical protein
MAAALPHEVYARYMGLDTVSEGAALSSAQTAGENARQCSRRSDSPTWAARRRRVPNDDALFMMSPYCSGGSQRGAVQVRFLLAQVESAKTVLAEAWAVSALHVAWLCRLSTCG